MTSHEWRFVRGIHLWPVDSPHNGPSNVGNVSMSWRHNLQILPHLMCYPFWTNFNTVYVAWVYIKTIKFICMYASVGSCILPQCPIGHWVSFDLLSPGRYNCNLWHMIFKTILVTIILYNYWKRTKFMSPPPTPLVGECKPSELERVQISPAIME